MTEDIKLLYVDLFCGAGGTSTGVELAALDERKCAKVVACVDHDANAIRSHKANHPNTLHFTEDIRTLEISPMVKHLDKKRRQYPKAKVVLWASLECTNFSNAKGEQPRDADSRTLANHLFRYIEVLKPDYIQIENVEEFMSWGDMDENGFPISKDKGTSYVRWVNNICEHGYHFDWRILNAADFGAYTSRKRFFGQFARHGLPIGFPVATHAKNGSDSTLFTGVYEKWKPVREVLDLEDDGESIFGRKKSLIEKTLERIYAGLIKFIAGGKEAFIVKWNSVNGKTGKYVPPSIDEPAPTITTADRFGLVTNSFLDMQYGNGTPASIDEPAPAVTVKPKHNLISVKPLIMNSNYGNIGSSTEVYETDSPATIQIKEFMALYGIADIRMRMLRIPELKRIMGFPEDYTLVGTQAEQKKFIGNAVEVTIARVLCEELCKILTN